ncbi:MAG: hypothetical protein ACKOZT_05230 [Cyanobium sp.]
MLQPPAPPTASEEQELLRPMAARLIWWQPAEQALRRPERVIAQVMDIGDFDTVLQLRRGLGDRRLAQVLQQAEAGWFSPRSWTYWHRKLGITPSGPVPPLPQRRFSGG